MINAIKKIYKRITRKNIQTREPIQAQRRFVSANTSWEQWVDRYYTSGSSDSDELYNALNYPRSISFRACYNRYKRQDIATRVINAPIDGTWKYDPIIKENNQIKETTPFEEYFKQLAKNLKLYPILKRLDILASLGEYSVLFIGTDDNRPLTEPLDLATRITYLTPIRQDRADIATYEQAINSPRYGQPKTYNITINEETTASHAEAVHYSRVLHVAENLIDNDIRGLPALSPIYNRLIGIDKLAAASPEMFWLGARPGYVLYENEKALALSDNDLNEVIANIRDFSSGLARFFHAQGMRVDSLSPQVSSPTEHINSQLKLISAATKIPLRILVGSERGQLASSQDERAWLGHLEDRRNQVGSLTILRPLIDRLIALGALPAPSSGEYTVEWPPILISSEKDQADATKTKMEAIAVYKSERINSLIPEQDFLKNFYSQEEAERMIKETEKERVKQEDERTETMEQIRSPRTEDNPRNNKERSEEDSKRNKETKPKEDSITVQS